MSDERTNYAVFGCKPWNRRVFEEIIRCFPGRWEYFDSRDSLDASNLKRIDPRYLFFLHWSWIVPQEVVSNYDCVCFHMADVPYGRGGSPLQNLISRGHRTTVLSALRMVEELDAGPVYCKRPLSLEGGAEEIFIRATELSARMIEHIIETQPTPTPQQGEAVVFPRRTAQQSEIPQQESLSALHDFVRMLDADGYPPAFLEHRGYRYEFRRSALYDGRIEADVTITPCRER